MDVKEKLALLEEAFEMDEGTLEADMQLADVDEYNSMAKLALIVLASDEFDKKLTGEQVRKFETVQDILDFLEA